MAEPPDQRPAAAGCSHLRASHADRDQVIGVLKAAFVQGRLAKDELDSRVSQTLAARTYGELAGLTADLPAGLADAVPTGRAVRAQTRPPMGNATKAGICVVIAVAVAVIVSIPTGGMALFIFAPFYFMALLVAGAQMLANRHDKRSRGQLPPRPATGAGGQASERPPLGDPPADPGHQHAEAARRRLPRPLLPGSRSLRRWHPRGLPAAQRPAITRTT